MKDRDKMFYSVTGIMLSEWYSWEQKEKDWSYLLLRKEQKG